MPRSFVEQASARCSVSGSKLWFNCNPEGPMHWFYREWILRAEERGALYLHFTMDDKSVALAAHSGAVRKGIQRDILPAVHPGRVDGGEGAHL